MTVFTSLIILSSRVASPWYGFIGAFTSYLCRLIGIPLTMALPHGGLPTLRAGIAGGTHLTSLLFHIANALLLFLWLQRSHRGLRGRSFLVAALFALHPLHVESVAWVAERKDVLSTFFWLLTMWAYVWYVEVSGAQAILLDPGLLYPWAAGQAHAGDPALCPPAVGLLASGSLDA